MVAFPVAKINLGLNILRKRSDEYHDIDTCFYPLPNCDILEILPGPETTFTTSGLPVPGKAEDNLCLKAWRLLHKTHHIPTVQIHLHKVIPMGAGLGGGSSDAATALIMLNKLFNLNLPASLLSDYALQLGSDCPFFLHSKPLLASGRGEILEPANISLKGYHLVLICPQVHVSTAEAYAGITPSVPDRSVRSVLDMPIIHWRDQLHNDFETTVFKKYPELAQIKQSLYAAGAVYASMSGSGSAMFGIFDESPIIKSVPITWQGTLS